MASNQALSLQPTGLWEGIDGPWSTFRLDVGSSPPQTYHIIPSTSGSQIWLPDLGKVCGSYGDKLPDCPQSRGIVGTARPLEDSLTWEEKTGIYTLQAEPALFEDQEGDMGSKRGLDGISIYTVESETKTGNGKQVIVAYSTEHYWLGLLGLSTAQTAYINENKSSSTSSILVALKESGAIPSLSYGYTAGSSYRELLNISLDSPCLRERITDNSLASLTLGGYDANRRSPNPLDTVSVLINETSTNLKIQLWGVTVKNGLTSGEKALMKSTESYSMFLDSSTAQIWLPDALCTSFVDAFQLSEDEGENGPTGYFRIDNSSRAILIDNNASIGFSVGKASGADSSIEINFPYAAFDKIIEYPYYDKNYTYFPIRRAASDGQFVFGLTFFQETYITVDWENNILNLTKATPATAGTFRDIRSIAPVTIAKQKLGAGAIAGTTISCLFVVFVLSAVGWWMMRRRRKVEQEKQRNTSIAGTFTTFDAENGRDKSELMSDNGGSIRKAKMERQHSDELDSTMMNYLSLDGMQPELMSTQLLEAEGEEVAQELSGETSNGSQEPHRTRSSVHELES